MKILESNTFSKAIKKFHRNQIDELKKVIEKIRDDPTIGEMKKGDLAGVRVHKFYVHHQLILLAYIHEAKKQESTITLLDVSSHENFYTSLKKQPEIKNLRKKN